MAIKEHLLLPLFEQFIKDTEKGKRTKSTGERIKPQTINTYRCVQRLLTIFCDQKNYTWRVCEYQRLTKREKLRERTYWKKFERHFTAFMLRERNAYDNYTGNTYKQLKTFFHYLNNEKLLDTGPYFRMFKIIRQEVPVTALTTEQLLRLIYDDEFEQSLPVHLQRTKDMFVFGSTCAFRFSDLLLLKPFNLQKVNGSWYVRIQSKKTQATQSIKLPEYAVAIAAKYYATDKKYLFPRIALRNYNLHLKQLGEKMGLTMLMVKNRSRHGIINYKKQKVMRFCDTMSSHLMRKTGITNLLTLGMPENLVKHISGHAGDSKSFHRYVAYSQTYMTEELDKIFAKMKPDPMQVYGSESGVF